MESALLWGLDCIRFIQTGATPQLTFLMKIITTLGSAAIYIIILPLVYWCVDEKKCLRLGTAVLVSVWLNLLLKFLLDQPRPFFPGYDPSVGMISERMGGFPSGHAQNSLVLLTIIASWLTKKWAYITAAILCLLIGFSRVYLGVHFPTDVLGGWIIGGIVLALYFFTNKRIEELITPHSPRAGLVACAALAFIMILYRPSAEIVLPGGMLLGLGTGYFINRKYIGLDAAVNSGKTAAVKYLTLLARFLLGMAGLVSLFIVTEKMTAHLSDSGNYHLYIFMRFILIALWITAGAPWLFRFLRLTTGNTNCTTKSNTEGNTGND